MMIVLLPEAMVVSAVCFIRDQVAMMSTVQKEIPVVRWFTFSDQILRSSQCGPLRSIPERASLVALGVEEPVRLLGGK
jgi:hypothetical protein